MIGGFFNVSLSVCLKCVNTSQLIKAIEKSAYIHWLNTHKHARRLLLLMYTEFVAIHLTLYYFLVSSLNQ